jgi:hypothetical protein
MTYGNTNARRKLTEADARMIRELHEYNQAEIRRLNETLSAKALAEKFGVHVRTVEAALCRRNWGRV